MREKKEEIEKGRKRVKKEDIKRKERGDIWKRGKKEKRERL